MLKKMMVLLFVSASLFGNSFNRIPDEYKETCMRIQIKYNIPDDYLFAVPMVESSWNPRAVSSARCLGLMQLNPKYHDYFVEMFWDNPETFSIYNPYHNLEMGFAYLAYLIDKFDGSIEKGLSAYNAGPSRVVKGDIPIETIRYVIKIKSYCED